MGGNFISLVLGLMAISREKKDLFMKLLQERSEVQREEFARFMENVIERGETEKEGLLIKLMENMEAIRKKIVTKQEIEELERKIDKLNKELQSI